MKSVFLSFNFKKDNWRVQQVRNIGSIDEQQILNYNDWESIKQQGDATIEKWINEQMNYKACVVVLIGSETANRKWINYEIRRAWDGHKPIVGIYIHRLEDVNGKQSTKGENPFKYISLKDGRRLDEIVPCFEPSGSSGTEVYSWIKNNIEMVVEKAVKR